MLPLLPAPSLFSSSPPLIDMLSSLHHRPPPPPSPLADTLLPPSTPPFSISRRLSSLFLITSRVSSLLLIFPPHHLSSLIATPLPSLLHFFSLPRHLSSFPHTNYLLAVPCHLSSLLLVASLLYSLASFIAPSREGAGVCASDGKRGGVPHDQTQRFRSVSAFFFRGPAGIWGGRGGGAGPPVVRAEPSAIARARP